jgi:thymidine kinase
LFIGPMSSQKTTRMVRDVERHDIARRSCIIVKYADDKRYESTGIVTHAGHEYRRVRVITANCLTDVIDILAAHEVIGIDEVQFFPDSVEVLQALANAGKVIIAAGLDANFRATSFARMGELIPLAEDVIKLKAVCTACGEDASFTRKIVPDDELLDIGGLDKYQAVCRACMWPQDT